MDRKKALLVAIGHMKPDDEEDGGGEEGEVPEEVHKAAEALLEAVKGDDAEAVAKALMDAHAACEGMQEQE
jgi:hypothetical protein